MLSTNNTKIFTVDDEFEQSYIQLDNSSAEKNPFNRAAILFYYEDELDTAPSDFVERLDLSGCRVFLLNLSADELFKVKNKNASSISRQSYIFQQFV